MGMGVDARAILYLAGRPHVIAALTIVAAHPLSALITSGQRAPLTDSTSPFSVPRYRRQRQRPRRDQCARHRAPAGIAYIDAPAAVRSSKYADRRATGGSCWVSPGGRAACDCPVGCTTPGYFRALTGNGNTSGPRGVPGARRSPEAAHPRRDAAPFRGVCWFCAPRVYRGVCV